MIASFLLNNTNLVCADIGDFRVIGIPITPESLRVDGSAYDLIPKFFGGLALVLVKQFRGDLKPECLLLSHYNRDLNYRKL